MNIASTYIAAIAVGLALPLAAMAQPTPATGTSAAERSPVTGDPGAKPSKAHKSAAKLARADKQPAGTMNGNAPDRASAGGGSR